MKNIQEMRDRMKSIEEIETVKELAELHAKAEKPYLVFRDEEVLTFKEFNDRANRVANGLLDLGVNKGDKVGIFLSNCPEFSYSFVGILKTGAVIFPFNFYLRGDPLKYAINHSEIDYLISSFPLFEDKLKPLTKELKFPQETILIGRGKPPIRKYYPFSNIMKAPSQTPTIPISGHDLAVVLYTSGTTGPPKGVMIPNKMLVRQVEYAIKRYNWITEDERTLWFYPLYHIGGIIWLLATLGAKATLCLEERFSASRFWTWVNKYKATSSAAFGLVLPALTKLPITKEEKEGLKYLKTMFTFSKAGREAAEKRWPSLPILEGYGLTEAQMIFVETREKPGMGMLPFYEAKICDDKGVEVPIGTVGEIVVNQEDRVFVGYYKNPEKTEETLRNGFYYTQDCGRFDEKGSFYYVDRKKDMIRRGGENISSFEVENIIGRHPKVQEVALVGIPDEMVGEEVVAHVVLKAGEKLPPKELIRYCNERMAYFQVPRYIKYRESLPKTPTFRVQKFELRKEGTADAWDRVKAGIKLKR